MGHLQGDREQYSSRRKWRTQGGIWGARSSFALVPATFRTNAANWHDGFATMGPDAEKSERREISDATSLRACDTRAAKLAR